MPHILTRAPVYDPSRLARGRQIEWRVSRRTHLRFRELLLALVETELEDQTSYEVQNRAATLRDDIRHLPGYPQHYNPELDVIIPVVTTEQK